MRTGVQLEDVYQYVYLTTPGFSRTCLTSSSVVEVCFQNPNKEQKYGGLYKSSDVILAPPKYHRCMSCILCQQEQSHDSLYPRLILGKNTSMFLAFLLLINMQGVTSAQGTAVQACSPCRCFPIPILDTTLGDFTKTYVYKRQQE